ncbi:MAG: LamG domain-containing protein [Lentisphaerae bacterium]|nr:LamG domain-containing protein [Lentisphaerota bacterium]
MKSSVVLSLLLAVCTIGGAQHIPVRRMRVPQRDLTPFRRKTAERMMMFPEIQYKYGLFQNFLNYIDRPLFYDRFLRYKGDFQYTTRESFLRDCQIRKSYGFDGGGSLCSAIWQLHKTTMGYLEKTPELRGKYYEFPQFSFGGGNRKINPEPYVRVLDLALKSAFTPRIKGRIPISTYHSFLVPPARMQELLTFLRKKYGNTFAVCGELFVSPADKSAFYTNGKWNSHIREKYRKRIDGILSVYDGIQIDPSSRRRKSYYQTVPCFEIYDREILPLLLKALKRKENKDKLVFGKVLHGYINHIMGVNYGEFGTATARGTLDRLAQLNCDLIFFFEWNEFNENTCWQPTLYNSFVLQRLVRFYGNIMRGESPVPNPGDEQQIPPLAVSYRDQMRAGESLQIELLNIPDALKSSMYTAKLELTDIKGKVLVSFPEEKFDCAKLDAVTFSLPSSKLAGETVVCPRVIVRNFNGRKSDNFDLQYIYLHPTVCVNYKCIRQSLRDLLQPEKTYFKVSDAGNGRFHVSAAVAAGELLSSVEILENGREVFAVGAEDPEKDVTICCSFNSRKSATRTIRIRMKNGGNWSIRGADRANVSPGKIYKKGDTATLYSWIWSARNSFFITLPRKLADKAELLIETGGEKLELHIADLLRAGRAAHTFSVCRFEAEYFKYLTDVPEKLRKKEVEFKTELPSNSAYPVYQLRVVTESGRIYRSCPVIPRAIPDKKEKLFVHCEEKDKVVPVNVPSVLVPRLNWKISSASGDVIPSREFPGFKCDLGGGFNYGGAFLFLKPPAGKNVPEKRIENGETILYFDGSSYLHFPVETFPRGSFKLAFEVRPDGENSPELYTLFRHFDDILGSVTCFVRYDRLQFAFAGRDLKTDLFMTGLELPPGKWSKVCISYDLQQLKISVNGQEISYLLDKKLALYFKSAIFGGHTKAEFGLPAGAGYFRGSLKSLSISHNTY